jgi:hypothetical protein
VKNFWLKISFQILIFFLHTNFIFAQNNSNVAKAYIELREHHKKNLLPRFHRILNDKDKILLKLKQDLLAYQSKPDFGLKCKNPENYIISMCTSVLGKFLLRTGLVARFGFAVV